MKKEKSIWYYISLGPLWMSILKDVKRTTITWCIYLFFFAILIILSLKPNPAWFTDLITIKIFLYLFLPFILSYYQDKCKAKKLNHSIDYYKERMHLGNIIIQIILIYIFAFMVVDNYTSNKQIIINNEIILTINLSLSGLVFVIYAFLIPSFNSNIQKGETYINSLNNKNNLNLPELEYQYGKLYKLKRSYNLINYEMVSFAFVFCLSLFSYFILTSNDLDAFYLVSILYAFYLICKLMIFIMKFNNYNLKMHEDKRNNAISSLPNSNINNKNKK